MTPPPEAIILVAIMPSPRDMDLARLLGWYRIPLRTAPKVIEVDYLAFYQPASFGKDHCWQIEVVAEVRGHELVRRRDLFKNEIDHPHADEEYFKIAIGPLQALKRPIQAKTWRRVTFLYSTGLRLKQAETLNDLVVKDNERKMLWRTLRERAVQGGRYRVEDIPQMELDPGLLAMLGGIWQTGDEA